MLSYKTVLIISLCGFIVTIIFGFAAYQSIFEFAIKDQVTLHKKNYVRQFYLKYPIPLDFRVYFFNVTNPEEVHNGGIPILDEIGPYCYDVYKERVDVEDNEDEDSLTYSPRDTYIFNKERTGNLDPDDYVTTIHPLLTGMVMHVATKQPQFISILNDALPHMFDTTSMYLTAKVRDILFDGMLINCTSKDFAAMAVCTQLKMKIPGIKIEEKDYLKFGLFSQRNGTMPMRVKVLRGIQNSKDLGRLISVDNQTRTTIWTNEECNQFRGTDGWIYPPLAGKAETLWIHPTELCMNIHADYVEDTTSNGIAVRKYFSDFEDQCTNCSLQKPCPPKGLLDLSDCIKVPIYVSLPHFLRSDEKLLQNVRGLKPDTESHITRILLEETLSLPMEAQIRIQFNFPIQPLERISFMQTVPEVVHPFMWIEMGVVLNGSFLGLIKGFFCFLTIMEVGKYVSLILCFGGIVYGSYLYFNNNKKLYSMKNTIVYDQK